MKKQWMIILAVFISMFLLLGGCMDSTDTNTSGSSEVVSSEEPEVESTEKVITISADWPYYSTLRELIDTCDYVIVGKVEETLPTIRIQEDPEVDTWVNYTPSRVLVEKTIVGNVEEGAYLDIVQMGGTYSGIAENDKQETITEVVEYVEFLEEDTEYLLFVKGESNVGKYEYPYFLAAPMVGYSKIINGQLKTSEYNNLFDDGISLEEAIRMIEESQADTE